VYSVISVNDRRLPGNTKKWTLVSVFDFDLGSTHTCVYVCEIPAKKWGDTEIAERGRSVLVMRARYRSAGLTPYQRGWTDSG